MISEQERRRSFGIPTENCDTEPYPHRAHHWRLVSGPGISIEQTGYKYCTGVQDECPEIDTIKSGVLKGARCEVKGPHEIHRVELPGGWSSWRTKEKKTE